MQHITTLQWIQFCYLASQTCDLFLHEDDTSNQNYTNPGKENNHGDHQPPFSRLFLARALLHYGSCRYQLIAVTLRFFSECSTKKACFVSIRYRFCVYCSMAPEKLRGYVSRSLEERLNTFGFGQNINLPESSQKI